jgi:Ca2+-binding RTX toxin-like protein
MLQTQPYFTAFTIDGTDAAETITFTDTSTLVNAGEGVNTISGTSGNNYIISGGGADTIVVTSGHNTILAGAGANTITATLGNNVITSGDGADTITVTSGNNIINAGGGANTIVATSGINEINTGDGADTITTGGLAYGGNTLNAGEGPNEAEGPYIGEGPNEAEGPYTGEGPNEAEGPYIGEGPNEAEGNTINAGDGANTVTSGAGNDKITSGSGADTISAGDGDNVVKASNGANTVTTGAGNDVVYTGVDADTIATGAGDDVIIIKGGADTIAAGAGNDTLIADFSFATDAVSINTLAGTATAGYAGNISGLGIATFAGVENFEITSGDFNDTITTGDGADVVHAGAGDDTVNLAGGDDEAIYTLASNYGATDVYLGGAGNDTLTLEFTADEWNNNPLVQSEIARYQAHLVDDSSDEFHFVSGLTVSEFENLSVRIGEGDATDLGVAPVDEVPAEGNPAVDELSAGGNPAVDIDDVSTDFESGFAGWHIMGRASVVHDPIGTSAMAKIVGGGNSEGEIEDFLGAEIFDGYDGLDGSAIMTTLALNAGDTLSFDYFYQSDDELPYNDFAVYMGVDGQTHLLSNVEAVGDYGNSGWNTVEVEITTTGVYDIGFAALDAVDSAVEFVSTLYVDNIEIA